MRGRMLIFLAVLCLLLLSAGWLAQQEKMLEQERTKLETEIMLLEYENAQLRDMISELHGEQAALGQRMQDWLDEWEVDIWEATSYAPLDPRAIPGVCYSGDPNITASGAKVIPYVTAAAGRDIPYETLVRIRNVGFRKITDRGGRIGNGYIDLAVQTREEAFAWGRRQVKVIFEKRKELD